MKTEEERYEQRKEFLKNLLGKNTLINISTGKTADGIRKTINSIYEKIMEERKKYTERIRHYEEKIKNAKTDFKEALRKIIEEAK